MLIEKHVLYLPIVTALNVHENVMDFAPSLFVIDATGGANNVTQDRFVLLCLILNIHVKKSSKFNSFKVEFSAEEECTGTVY